MLVAAALVPDTATLVPGVTGGAGPVHGLLGPAMSAIEQLMALSPDVVVVVAPGPVDRVLGGTVSSSLGAAGIPDAQVRWPAQDVTLEDDATSRVQPSVASVVALHLVHRAGQPRAVRVVEVTPAAGADALQALGSSFVAGRRTGLVVVGSGSGRHGPDAPLADDDRAPAYDAALLADLADASPEARARLASADAGVAAELAVRGWAPWQVLVGATADVPVVARLLADEVVLGAQHAVLLWTVPV
ncbi:hypothetical protein [Cellulomonas sp. URHE0023]|uniref:hypothetical protein n=1 Tax=Cellulomonas sp. URHE0023 TaxID=1380354 RepID=UPI000480807F|nr:hypothetical protein [Cellulomonas sp. URHE0023]